MTLSMAFFTFINAWCVSLFFVIPFGIETEQKAADSIEYAASPKKIHWKKTFIRATIVSTIFTVALALIIRSGMVPLHDMSDTL